jgi:hypothetical protein
LFFNERRRLAVKLRLNGATIAETVVQYELGRSAMIRAMQACERGGWKAAVPRAYPGSATDLACQIGFFGSPQHMPQIRYLHHGLFV